LYGGKRNAYIALRTAAFLDQNPRSGENKGGLLIHISGLLSRFTRSFYRSFNASKRVVEALAENYRVELSKFGIESCIVEPG
jgi:NAD(P)-dependent dehydrogenase (short-subunit alcohol dehydrogenase family)